MRVTVTTPDPNFNPTPLEDFEIEASSLPTELEICVRDHQCEDGDEVRVSVNGVALFSRELFNTWYCETVMVNQRETVVELYAINGSGFKGPCDYSDVNTGEIRVSGGSSQTQSWEHGGGTGSSANIIVTITDGSGDDHGGTRTGATTLALGGSGSGRIEPGSDVDYFIVQVTGTGTLTVYTTGNLDTTGELQDNSGSRLAFNDDAGTGTNFRIEHSVSSGTYYIEVESYQSNTGNYTLHAEFSGSDDTGGGGNADLTVDTPTVSNNNPDAGAGFTLRATVRNRGNGSAEATTLRYYRSTDSTITTGDSAQGRDSVGTLSASGTSSESVSLTAASNAGTYYYGACVDSVSGESDTGNNCSSGVRVTVSDTGPTPPPDGTTIVPEMVSIPGGSFRMGGGRNNTEKPVHSVTVPAFSMGKYEVTFTQWDACVADGGCGGHRPGDASGRGNRPVYGVSWDDVQAFINWLNSKTGESYRLPTEAEWEYAARAGSNTEYSWGDSIGSNRANCDDECGDRWEHTAPVGSFSANAWGLHDMHGNVYEWVEDCWNDSYAGAPSDGRAWTSGDCSLRVIRGGSLYVYPFLLRSAVRHRYTRWGRSSGVGLGFRLAQDK